MVCGQIHAPDTLPNNVHMHLMNEVLRRLPAILETQYVYFAMLCNRGLSLPSHDTLAVWATQSPFLKRSLVQSAKSCCLQELGVIISTEGIPENRLLIPICRVPWLWKRHARNLKDYHIRQSSNVKLFGARRIRKTAKPLQFLELMKATFDCGGNTR